MKKIKSYTGIWNVEKVLYAINDFNLPFPVTFKPYLYKGRGQCESQGRREIP